MAKLTGVQTLDMVNGEITKVAYDGEEYVKVDRKAKDGDLIQPKASWESCEAGAFYACAEVDDDGDAKVDTERGYRSSNYRYTYEVFRKVEVPQSAEPTPALAGDLLSERVDALEKRVDEIEKGTQQYVLVTDREPQVGDYVKYDEEPSVYITADKYYEIIEIDSYGDPQIIDDEGDEYDTGGDDFEVYAQQAGAVETEESQEIQVGDTVKLSITDGKTPHYSYGNVKNGEIGTVVRIDSDLIKVDFPSQNNWSAKPHELVKVGVPVAKAEPKLKVGDYAKVVREGYSTMVGFRKDDIVKIIESQYGEDDEDYKVERINGISIGGYVSKSGGYIVKVSAEEVAQATADAKWAKLGRKPGEFKKGDIVRVIDGSGSTVKDGDIGEVGEFNGQIFRVNTIHNDHGNFQKAKNVELIAPVESRVDID